MDKDKDKDFKLYAAQMKALGDETRVKIFDLLSEGERCACKILDELTISQPTLSYHMKILCECGLVSGRKEGIWMMYTINPDSVERLHGFFSELDLEKIRLSLNCSCKGE